MLTITFEKTTEANFKIYITKRKLLFELTINIEEGDIMKKTMALYIDCH
jgi:hypothetical protein